VLTQLSLFWFDFLDTPNHLITAELAKMELPFDPTGRSLEGRSMLVRKAEVVPIECVVRGYLSGSGWKEYRKHGTVCGIKLPAGLTESAQLPEPIFTPATKADQGHDENISLERMADIVGSETAELLRQKSIEVYCRGAQYAAGRGIILADTKFEWGRFDGELILIDEVLTPDSSRFWPADHYQPGHGQPSFDKQFVRDWLEATGWDKESPPPVLPPDVIELTRAKYVEAYQRITGRALSEAVGSRK
jgi:phosphoribosylaminoimidazole-succinocarboxamide synthase